MTTTIHENVLAALTVTHRAAGWNFRPADTIPIDLPNGDGTACRLLVVPYRRWAYRRWERLVQERQRGGHAALPRPSARLQPCGPVNAALVHAGHNGW